MRAAALRTPVVIMSDVATVQAKVKALDQGADDFLITPCDPEEVLARIRAVVRRSQGHAKSTLALGPVELLLDRRDVRVHGESLHLSRREYAVLELLFLKQGVILNKGAFLTHLYCGMDEPEMKTIDVIICRLRKKLATAGVPTLIDTVWGCGYILRDPSLDRQDDARVMNHQPDEAWREHEVVAA
jgi:two-component system, cell cycle response regulator CtrA